VKKIGIFGGTFDPIHIGHLRVAAEFGAELELDEVLMMVAATPPHRDPPVAAPEDRLRMVQLAVQDYPGLTASDIELVREGPSYTIDTFQQIRRSEEGTQVWMALGGDAYALIRSWHRPADVLAQAHVVVLTRPGFAVDLMAPLPEEISERYSQGENGIFIHDSGATLRTLQVTPLDISSSMIRRAVAEERNIGDLVTARVLKYIRQKGLYRSKTM